MKKYFYAQKGNQIGPFSLEEILTKNLDKDILIWHEGLPDWVRLSEIPELNTKSNESLPPPIRVKESGSGKKNFSKILYVFAVIVVILVASGIYLYPKWENEKEYEEALSVYMRTDSIQFEVFNELSIKDHPKSNFILGIYYARLGDSIKAKESFEKVIVKGNEVPALYHLYLVNPKDSLQYKSSIEKNFTNWVNEISEPDWLSQLYAGRIYEFGIGVKLNPQKAIEFYDKASKNGSIEAVFSLGLIYMGVEEVQDYEKALSLLKEADELGFPDAAGQIAEVYGNGLGVKVNQIEAASWHIKAAKNNNIYSQKWIGYLYDYGLFGFDNSDSAKYWYQRVIDNKNFIRYGKSNENVGQIKKEAKDNLDIMIRAEKGEFLLKKSQSRKSNSNSNNSIGVCHYCQRTFYKVNGLVMSANCAKLYTDALSDVYFAKLLGPIHEAWAMDVVNNGDVFCSRKCVVESGNCIEGGFGY